MATNGTLVANGTLLWAGDAAGAGPLLEETAREFGLTVQVCVRAECLKALETRPAQLVVVELGGERTSALAVLAELHNRAPGLPILAAAGDGEIATIRGALEAGASDVLSLPLSAPELRKALVKFAELGAQPPLRRAQGEVLTICGARGGLGATTIAVNLAFGLRAMGEEKVVIVDLDLQRGDVAAFLNLTPLNSLATIASARGRVDETFIVGTLARHPSGVCVLPAPPAIEDADTVGREDVARALRILRTQFRWTVVDTARTITGATVAALEQSQRVFVLTDLSLLSVRAAARLVEFLPRFGTPSQHVHLLVTEIVPGPVSLRDAVRAIGKEILLVVPRDQAAACAAMNAGVPLNGSESALAATLTEFAAKVSGIERPPRARPSWLLPRIFSRGGRAEIG